MRQQQQNQSSIFSTDTLYSYVRPILSGSSTTAPAMPSAPEPAPITSEQPLPSPNPSDDPAVKLTRRANKTSSGKEPAPAAKPSAKTSSWSSWLW